MNKKQTERIATIALAAFLIGMSFCQVAHATDAGSYKFGFAWGSNDGYWGYVER